MPPSPFYTPQADMALQRASKEEYGEMLFTGHTGFINWVTFSPDGKYILTASTDQTARLWDANTGQQLRTFGGSTTANDVAFSPDGQSVFVAWGDRTIRRWDVDYDVLIRSVCTRLLHDFTDDERVQYGLGDQDPTCSSKY